VLTFSQRDPSKFLPQAPKFLDPPLKSISPGNIYSIPWHMSKPEATWGQKTQCALSYNRTRLSSDCRRSGLNHDALWIKTKFPLYSLQPHNELRGEARPRDRFLAALTFHPLRNSWPTIFYMSVSSLRSVKSS